MSSERDVAIVSPVTTMPESNDWSQEQNRCLVNVRPAAWNPANPAMLFMPVFGKEAGKIEGYDIKWSHPGASYVHSCELEALVQMIQAYEEYWICNVFGSDGNNTNDNAGVIIYRNNLHNDKAFSYKQRSQSGVSPSTWLAQQCRQVVSTCITAWSTQEPPANINAKDDEANLLLLTSMYTVLHLSDVFLPLLEPQHGSDASVSFNHAEPYEQPGRATADMVRYLRSNHVDFPYELDEEFFSATQPDYYSEDYWGAVYAAVLRGNLETAWSLLERHSLYARSLTTKPSDDFLIDTLEEIHEGFSALKELLYRAPLPAGRNEYYDDAIGMPSRDESDEVSNHYLDGLQTQSSDYLYWEPTLNSSTAGLAANFQVRSAKDQYHHYQDYVRQFRKSFALLKRVPELDTILAFLSGDLSEAHCTDWAAQLCSELLYKNPFIRPSQISARARKLMQQYDSLDSNPQYSTLLHIMEGSAGEAIYSLYELGGGSQAALPTTLFTMIFSVYLNTGILPESVANRKNEFICETAWAIVSSTNQEYGEVGLRLALKFLLPHILHDGSFEVLSVFAELLEHRSVRSDAELRVILDLCEPLMELKSMQVVNACTSLIADRFRTCMRNGNTRNGVHWLLVGLEVEEKYLASIKSGTVYRHMVKHFYQLSHALLSGLVNFSELNNEVIEQARDSIAKVDELKHFNLEKHNDILTLRCVVELFNAVADGRRPEEIADLIVRCLRERKNSHGIAQLTTPLPLHWLLLQLSVKILDKEDDDLSSPCPFSTRGITVLMDVCLKHRLMDVEQKDKKELDRMDVVLSKRSAQATVTDMRKLGTRDKTETISRDQLQKMTKAEVFRQELEIQEKYVEMLLDNLLV